MSSLTVKALHREFFYNGTRHGCTPHRNRCQGRRYSSLPPIVR